MDLEKLPKAPFTSQDGCVYTADPAFAPGEVFSGAQDLTEEQRYVMADAIALCFNAFDVMMRRGWSARQQTAGRRKGLWYVIVDDGVPLYQDAWDFGHVQQLRDAVFFKPDPFTAIVEADRWYRENVESKQTSKGGANQ